MAVPFTLPDDDAALEQIIEQIYHLLRVVQQQMQLRRTRDASLQATPRGKCKFLFFGAAVWCEKIFGVQYFV